MATQASVSCSGTWSQSDDLLITSLTSDKYNFSGFITEICLPSNGHGANSLLFTVYSKRMASIIYSNASIHRSGTKKRK